MKPEDREVKENSVRCLSAEFEGSFPECSLLPPQDCDEIALVGRSNVGKSSLLNALVERRSLARVGKTPGVTRAMNTFSALYRHEGADISFRIVDLPGYGFAKVPLPEKERWNRELSRYLHERPALLLLLVDCRRELEEEEEFFLSGQFPAAIWVVGTKRDQLKKSETPSWLPTVKSRGLKHYQVSVEKRFGVEELRIDLFHLLAERSSVSD